MDKRSNHGKELNCLFDLVRLIRQEGLEDIVIQVHNDPDADAFGSGYAVYCYLKDKGYNPRLVYSGDRCTHKANMLLMQELLKFKVSYERTMEKVPDLLITVDCCYGCKNVKGFANGKTPKWVAVIDHHRLKDDEMSNLPKNTLRNIRPEYNSCAAVIAKMFDDNDKVPENELNGRRFTLNTNNKVANALYYGLYMDTCAFSELHYFADKDLQKAAKINRVIQRRLSSCNVSNEEVHNIGMALSSYTYDPIYRNAIVEVNTQEAGVLGITADLLIQVDTVDTCIVYFMCADGCKLAVRSCVKEISAADLVKFVLRDAPSDEQGGGHFYKAGGFAKHELIRNMPMKSFLLKAVETFHKEVTLFRAGKEKINLSGMTLRIKKTSVKVGYVRSTDIAEKGETINIHMLEGDTTCTASNNLYLVVGVMGEVYPVEYKKFKQKYTICEGTPGSKKYKQPPSVLIDGKDNSTYLEKHLKCCKPHVNRIYAKQLNSYMRVFTQRDKDNYMYGKPGDYLVYPEKDPTDVYIIRGEIMDELYSESAE